MLLCDFYAYYICSGATEARDTLEPRVASPHVGIRTAGAVTLSHLFLTGSSF